MNEGLVIIFVLLLWLAPFVGAWIIGADKGRGFQGFTLGLLFGVFGLIAIAAMEPSDDIVRRRQASLADLIADRLSAGGTHGDTRVCPACFGSIPRVASACMHCGRDVPATAPDDDNDEMDEPSIGVAVNHIVYPDTGPLMLFVEPGWITLSACDPDCDTADHELALSIDDSRRLLDALRVSAHEKRPSRVYVEAGLVTLEWHGGADGEPGRELIMDWSTQFAAATTLDADRSHGIIVLTGDISRRTSPIGSLEGALATAVRISDLWATGQATTGDVRTALTTVGTLA